MKLKNLVQLEESVSWENVQSGDIEKDMDHVTQRINAAKHMYQIASDYLEPFQNDYFITRYDKGFDELFNKSPYEGTFARWISGKSEDFCMKPNTPNLVKIWSTIKKYAERTVWAAEMFDQAESERKALNKQYRAHMMTNTTTSSTKMLTQAQITALARKQPKIVLVGSKKGGFESPLVSCQIELWVGPPEQYPNLTGTQMDLFFQIQKALKKAGLAPLTVLYGGRRSKQYKGINFVTIGADGKFAWRKYDPSPAAGQNWVYFNDGHSMKTSTFVENPVSYLNQHIK